MTIGWVSNQNRYFYVFPNACSALHRILRYCAEFAYIIRLYIVPETQDEICYIFHFDFFFLASQLLLARSYQRGRWPEQFLCYMFQCFFNLKTGLCLHRLRYLRNKKIINWKKNFFLELSGSKFQWLSLTNHALNSLFSQKPTLLFSVRNCQFANKTN